MSKKRINSKRKKKTSDNKTKLKKAGVILFIIVLMGLTIYHYRVKLAYYFSFKSPHAEFHSRVDTKKRIDNILAIHYDKTFGIDVSEYQGEINWHQLKKIDSTVLIQFVLIRATAGKNKVDKKFHYNFESAKNKNFIRGAYHYYRPNENSIRQAQLFIKTVQLEKGDLPPVLDIENLPKTQSIDSLKVGLKRWLNVIENHYKVKPIIYTGENYYDNFLKNDFQDYTFWIANYSKTFHQLEPDYKFWQFTESAKVKGINHKVDLNVFNGNKNQLEKILIK